MAEDIHSRIKRQRDAAMPDAKRVTEYRRYALGDQPGTLTAAQKRMLTGVTGHAVADNVCAVVLRTLAGRVELETLACEDEAVADYLAGLALKNALPALAAAVHLAAPRDGDHYVALRWQAGATPREGRVTLHREPCWDGETGVFVAFDDAGEPAWAVKDFHIWLGDPPRRFLRRTVYFPDHIERYVQDGGWRPYPDGETFTEPWVKRDGSPLHLPVILFAHTVAADETPYGRSDLAGGVLGLQDEINDIQRDITAAARLTGYQMYFAAGIPIERDAEGYAVPLAVGPGRVVQAESPDAEMAVLPAGSMQALIDAHLHKLRTVAFDTATPLHVITGDWPSGAALVRSEMPLVTKARRLVKTWSPAWATVAHRAVEIANTFGGLGLDEDAPVTATFADPQQLDEVTVMELRRDQVALLSQQENLRSRWAMLQSGVPEDAVEEIIRDRDGALLANDAAFTGIPIRGEG